MTAIEKANARADRSARMAGAPSFAIGGDLVSMHRWANVMAVRGSAQAAELRAKVAARMSKTELAAALRLAREDLAVAA